MAFGNDPTMCSAKEDTIQLNAPLRKPICILSMMALAHQDNSIFTVYDHAISIFRLH